MLTSVTGNAESAPGAVDYKARQNKHLKQVGSLHSTHFRLLKEVNSIKNYDFLKAHDFC